MKPATPPECFFFVEPDPSGKEEEATIHAICVKCRMETPDKFPDAWFYSGKFGPWTVTCYNCGGLINEYSGEEEDETSGQEAPSPI